MVSPGFVLPTPILLIWLVGVVLAIVSFKKHFLIALLALIGFVGLSADELFANFWLQRAIAEFPAGSSAAPDNLLGWLRIVRYVIQLPSWACLLGAIFLGRPGKSVLSAAELERPSGSSGSA